MHHQYVAANALERYLDKRGDLILTREQARERGRVSAAEIQNRTYFEAGFLNARNPDVPGEIDLDYQMHLLAMNDGDKQHLPIKEKNSTDKKDYWQAFLGRSIGLDTISYYLTEYLATGNSHVESTAENGFVATRRGETIHIEGIVEHNWSDRYDFAPGSGEAAKNALIAEKHGLAKPYELKAIWKQKLTGTIKIVNGKLFDPSFNWEDVD